MKKFALSLAIVLAASGAALADGSGSASSIDFGTLSVEQLDALASILAGLPRQ
jgi:hypothetical protein